MSVRWTRRPQNFCRRCGYPWYPRGKDRSAKCPLCESTDVALEHELAARSTGCLLALPFIALGLLIQSLAAVVVFLLDTLIRISIGSTRAGGAAAGWSFQTAVPVVGWVVDRSRPHLIRGLRQSQGAAAFLARWVASAKDDLLGEDDREVNPISLVAKLLALVIAAGTLTVLVAKAIRWASAS